MEQLIERGVSEPGLELFWCPAPLPDQEQPDVGVVQRPKDVGSADSVESGGEGANLVEGRDDRSLVRVKVGLDERPEVTDLVVARRCVADHPEQGADPALHHARRFRQPAELAFGVRLLEDVEVPRSRGDRRVVGVTLESEVPHGTKQPGFRFEREVHRLERNVGFGGDRAHRRRREAVCFEETLRGAQDRHPGRRRLLLPSRRPVGTDRLDILRHLTTLVLI